MLSFTTQPFTFEINGRTYSLPHATFGEAESLLEAFNAADGDRIIGVARSVFETRADAETMDAINSLGYKQAGLLFRAWLGGEPGESQPSAD
jgi:hypothetical protein